MLQGINPRVSLKQHQVPSRIHHSKALTVSHTSDKNKVRVPALPCTESNRKRRERRKSSLMLVTGPKCALLPLSTALSLLPLPSGRGGPTLPSHDPSSPGPAFLFTLSLQSLFTLGFALGLCGCEGFSLVVVAWGAALQLCFSLQGLLLL